MSTRDWASLLTNPNWPTGRPGVLGWCAHPGVLARPLRAGVVDASFTADLAEAICGPLEVREFGTRRVVRVGPPAEHGTALACVLGSARWPDGAMVGVRLSCAMVDDLSAPSLVDALEWLASESLDVLALPLGSSAWHEEVEVVLRKLMTGPTRPLVFASVGNGKQAPALFPARMAGVVGVGAGRDDGSLLDPAPPGPVPDLVAPGDRVLVRVGVAKLREMTGSSIACGIAAGIALRNRAMSNVAMNSRGGSRMSDTP